MINLSEGANKTLSEIIDNEDTPDYWENRYKIISKREKTFLKEYFEELSKANLILPVVWGNGYPWQIHVLKMGYLYNDRKKEEEESMMTQFERELNDLLERAEKINPPINAAAIGTDISKYNQPSNDWLNDAEIFCRKYLQKHPLYSRIASLLFHRTLDCFSQVASCLRSVAKDQDFIDKVNGIEKKMVPAYQAKSLPEYDVFLSHANADKQDFVDELYNSLNKLGVKIFYDKESLEWGDNWKERILDGTKKAEFAIIVISENFFGREWTETELSAFLNRQNRNGQKLILPIVHNITNEDLRKKYPRVAEIQAIDSHTRSCDEIALMFARQLIRRLKVEK